MLEEKEIASDPIAEGKAYKDYLAGKAYRCGHTKIENMTFCVICDGVGVTRLDDDEVLQAD